MQPLNIILREYLIYLITKQKHITKSQEANDVMKVVLCVDFFSRVVLYVLLNMCIPGLPMIGNLTDFSVEWYQKVGKIMYVLMVVCIWTPVAETCCIWFVKFFQRMVDTKRTLNPLRSKTKQKQVFIALWSGTDFLIPSNFS